MHGNRDLVRTASAVRSIVYGAFIFIMGICLVFCIESPVWRAAAPVVVAGFGAAVCILGIKRLRSSSTAKENPNENSNENPEGNGD